MKRNLDLIRQILLKIEQSPRPGDLIEIKIDGHTSEEIAYHLGLLHEAGYIIAMSFQGDNHIDWMPSRLTWEGHEFLDLARDDPRWKKAKEMVAQAGAFSFPILAELLKKLILNSFNQ